MSEVNVKGMAECLSAALLSAEQSVPASEAVIEDLKRLSGGANMETWSFDWVGSKVTEPLILRRLPGQTGDLEHPAGELTLQVEAALLEVASRHGVCVPVVRLVLRTEHGLGHGYIMSREGGEALPFRLLADDDYRDARDKLAFQCGQTLGRIHKIPLNSLPPGLSDHSGERLFQRAQELLDLYGNLSPVLQLGLNWLRDEPRQDPQCTLVHGDFRNGNLLVDHDGLVAVLDWELAHLGNPIQDLGYICANVWRFGLPKPVGGFGEYKDLLAGYESVTGVAPAMADIHYWQVHAALSWGIVCLSMLAMYRSGQDSTLERAAVGRRLSEAEIDLLLLMEGGIA